VYVRCPPPLPTTIEENLKPKAEKNNTKKNHDIIITAKQSIIQEDKDIPLNNKT